jgi:hypothetical protein
VALDTSGRNKLNLIETILPLVLGIVGAVALVAGILLARKPHEELAAEPPAAERTASVPANAAAEVPFEAPAERSIVPGMDGEPPAR